MEFIKELKLSIYESSLSDEDKDDLLWVVESTDDESTLSEVVTILESYKDKNKNDSLTSEDIKEIKEDLDSYKKDLKDIKSNIKNKKYIKAKIQIKHAKDRLERVKSILKTLPIDTDSKIKESVKTGITSALTVLVSDAIFSLFSDASSDLNTTAKTSAFVGGVSGLSKGMSDWRKPLIRDIDRQLKILNKLESKVGKE